MGALGWKSVGGLLRQYDKSTLEVLDVITPVKKFDHFGGPTLDTADWTIAGVNSGTAAYSAALAANPHCMRITTGAADDDDVDVASGINWLGSKGCCIEARIALNDIAGTAFCVGFTDATGEAADIIPVMYATATATITADECAMFFWDPDGTTDYVRATSAKATAAGAVHASTVAMVNGTFHIFRVEIDVLGNIRFWLDTTLVGTELLGNTIATPLCAYVGLINREGAANTADVDYIKVWQKP